jgi:A/G-specific adenine glycosylase
MTAAACISMTDDPLPPLAPLNDPIWVRSLRRKLLAWFDRAARDLPWRRSRDPYAIWVSEVMLQQTQVATVIGYFERFMQVFPTLAELAAADVEDVLRLWEGLGYYRRARALHQAARRLAAEHHGQVPDDAGVLAQLPGLGRYTVNAILSQAYERPLPILEANSRRVLCRLLGVRADPAQAAVQARLWQAAEALLPRRRIGAFNQALMELGALVCTALNPGCARCPLASLCVARRCGLEHKIPMAPRRALVQEVREVAVAVRQSRGVLLVQRPGAGRWAGLWEFPRRQVQGTHEQTAHALLTSLGLRADLGPELTTIRHSVTRFRITLVCFEAAYRSGKLAPGDYARGRWTPLRRLAAYPCSRPQRRLAEALLAPRTASLF